MGIDWERRSDYCHIDIATANRLMHLFAPSSNVAECTLLHGGKINSNYLVRLHDSGGKYILRIYGRDSHAPLVESNVLTALQGEAPVPTIHYAESDVCVFQRPFCIMEHVAGITLDRWILDENPVPQELAEHIGRTLASIHNHDYLATNVFGNDLELTEQYGEAKNWYPHFLNDRAGGRLGMDLQKQTRSFIEHHCETIDQLETLTTLTHGDFRPANIMVKDGKLVAILDWEWSTVGHPIFDLGQFLRRDNLIDPVTEDRFISSYNECMPESLPENWKELAKLADMAALLCMLNSVAEMPRKHADLRALIQKTVTTY